MDSQAYHLTWTTYGTWLPGDKRGWVASGETGIQAPNPGRKKRARSQMAEDPVILSVEQRELVDRTIREPCHIRGWTLHALNVRTNHVHVVITANRTADEVMNQFKAWTSRKLSDQAGLKAVVAHKAGRRRWWTEHGSTQNIYQEDYLSNAIHYVAQLQ